MGATQYAIRKLEDKVRTIKDSTIKSRITIEQKQGFKCGRVQALSRWSFEKAQLEEILEDLNLINVDQMGDSQMNIVQKLFVQSDTALEYIGEIIDELRISKKKIIEKDNVVQWLRGYITNLEEIVSEIKNFKQSFDLSNVRRPQSKTKALDLQIDGPQRTQTPSPQMKSLPKDVKQLSKSQKPKETSQQKQKDVTTPKSKGPTLEASKDKEEIPQKQIDSSQSNQHEIKSKPPPVLVAKQQKQGQADSRKVSEVDPDLPQRIKTLFEEFQGFKKNLSSALNSSDNQDNKKPSTPNFISISSSESQNSHKRSDQLQINVEAGNKKHKK